MTATGAAGEGGAVAVGDAGAAQVAQGHDGRLLAANFGADQFAGLHRRAHHATVHLVVAALSALR